MRSLRTALCALVLTGLPTSVALGTTSGGMTVPDLQGSVSPTVDRVGGPPRPMALTIRLGITSLDPAQLPATLAKAELKFTRGAVVNGAWFPKCDPARLRARKRCPRRSLLGRAKIGAAVGPSVAEQLAVPLTADLYNGPGGRSIIFHFKGNVPIPINVVQTAPLTKVRERFYGFRLVVEVPEVLQMPLVGLGTFTFRDRTVRTDKASIVCGGQLP